MVDLEAQLDRVAAPLGLDDGVHVGLEVVAAAVELVRQRPERPRLLEVVDVLGESDLVDPALGRRFDVALDGLDRVVDGLVRRAEMHVVVDDQSQEATSSRSAGVVTFSRRGSPSTARTRPPRRFDEARAVRSACNDCCKVKRVSKDWGDEGLRGLDGDEALALERLRDGLAVDAFDGVGDRERPEPRHPSRRRAR